MSGIGKHPWETHEHIMHLTYIAYMVMRIRNLFLRDQCGTTYPVEDDHQAVIYSILVQSV